MKSDKAEPAKGRSIRSLSAIVKAGLPSKVEALFRAAIRFLILSAFLALLLFPLLWMLSSSFQSNEELYRSPPRWIPRSPMLGNYASIIASRDFLRYYINNFYVSLITTALTMLAAVFAGYSLSRFRNRLTTGISVTLLSTQMFPVIGIIIALYAFFRSLKMINTHAGLVLALTAVALAALIGTLVGLIAGYAAAGSTHCSST